MFSLDAWTSLVPVMVIFLAVRVLPYWSLRHRGCDPYFFLLFADPLRPETPQDNPECATYAILLKAEALRRQRQRRRPGGSATDVPGYEKDTPGERLDTPALLTGLPFLLSLLPRTWVRHSYWMINHLLDLVCMSALFLLVTSELGGGLGHLVALLYAFSPALNSEFCRLTPRALAMPVFLFLLGNTFHWLQSESWFSFWVSVVLGTLLFYVHHLTLRVILFVMPFLAMTLHDIRWLMPILVVCLVMVVLDRRLFLAVLNFSWLAAFFRGGNSRVLYESLHLFLARWSTSRREMGSLRMMFRRYYRQAKVLFLMNPSALAVAIYFTDRPPHYSLVHFMIYWVLGIYLLAGLSLLFPAVRRWGIRLDIVQYAEWPSLFVTVLYLVMGKAEMKYWLILAVFPLLHLLNYGVRFHWLWLAGTRWCGMETPDLHLLLQRIAALDQARVLCFPTMLAGLTAYRTGKGVFWPAGSQNSHGLGLPGFPGYRPTMDLIRTAQVTHLLLDQTFHTLGELGLAEEGVLARSGHFLLYAFDRVQSEF
ncbi:MAG: hypothetical protein H7833_20125 [Magnetococcus sp. DMHC-1]|nr:hypothetical protein [Magnetococcales bacterium]